MANKASLQFYMGFLADGASTSLAFAVATAPMGFIMPGQSNTIGTLSGGLSLNVSDIQGLNVDPSFTGTVSLSSLLLGVATLSFSSAPSAGYHYVYGQLIF